LVVPIGGWRVAAPPAANLVAPVVWAVPAGIAGHRQGVQAASLVAHYVAGAEHATRHAE